METDLLIEALKAAPAAALVLLVVVYFLRYMREEREARQQIDSKRWESLKTINQQAHEHQRATTDAVTKAIDKNTEALSGNAVVIGKTLEALHRINGERGPRP